MDSNTKDSITKVCNLMSCLFVIVFFYFNGIKTQLDYLVVIGFFLPIIFGTIQYFRHEYTVSNTFLISMGIWLGLAWSFIPTTLDLIKRDMLIVVLIIGMISIVYGFTYSIIDKKKNTKDII